jgi:hypothetical protein
MNIFQKKIFEKIFEFCLPYSSSSKIRPILPKGKDGTVICEQQQQPESSAAVTLTGSSNVKVTTSQNNQYMIPVTLMTPCKTCNVTIAASSVRDIQNHICSSKDKNVKCTIEGCSKKFFKQITLKYHLKHYHKVGVKPCSDKARVKPPPQPENNEKVKQNNTDFRLRRFKCNFPACGKAYRYVHLFVIFFLFE